MTLPDEKLEDIEARIAAWEAADGSRDSDVDAITAWEESAISDCRALLADLREARAVLS